MIISIAPLQTGMYRATCQYKDLFQGEVNVVGTSHTDALQKMFQYITQIALWN